MIKYLYYVKDVKSKEIVYSFETTNDSLEFWQDIQQKIQLVKTETGNEYLVEIIYLEELPVVKAMDVE